ncbi:hypothetical protein FOL47_009203 [Perkinsus chesapeaki]|uniref:Uncharacterized protein n=1 Tax=Perkinsus chesapeaki TaxID=330153 RepID=A0A7J6L9T9_PERCH|nr:hypothetical protein FOL47_009203 [Perkinsus chesapeaki]
MSSSQRSSLPQKLALLHARISRYDTGDAALRSVVWEFLARTSFDAVRIGDASERNLHRSSIVESKHFEFMLRVMRSGRLRRKSSSSWHREVVRRVEEAHRVFVVSTLVHFESESLIMGTVTGELFCAPAPHPPPLSGTCSPPAVFLLAKGLGCCDGIFDVSNDGTIRTFSQAKGRCHDLTPVVAH